MYNLEDTPDFYDSMEYSPIGNFSADASGRLPRGVYRGTFSVDKPGDGWQEQEFGQPVQARYICFEALDSHNSDDRAAIAEFYILDDNGERLSREPWTIAWVDSEDVEQGNHSADKLFDLQESTYWSTAPGSAFPHSFVIDLGSVRNISAIQYLPRMEHGAPGAIKNYRVYVKTSPFSRSGS
ncbi:MAG: discoidin domain-containing protein [Muribaculaceae bacterium]|nr:discoidin domain-containing protein [Muribaculaceae bacterium]